jgi:hypothetical protein
MAFAQQNLNYRIMCAAFATYRHKGSTGGVRGRGKGTKGEVRGWAARANVGEDGRGRAFLAERCTAVAARRLVCLCTRAERVR